MTPSLKSLPEDLCSGFLCPEKIHRPQPVLNPRTLDLEASTLPRDHRGRHWTMLLGYRSKGRVLLVPGGNVLGNTLWLMLDAAESLGSRRHAAFFKDFLFKVHTHTHIHLSPAFLRILAPPSFPPFRLGFFLNTPLVPSIYSSFYLFNSSYLLLYPLIFC